MDGSAKQDLKEALDRSALASLKPLSTSLVVIFFVLIGFNLLDLPSFAVGPIVTLDIGLVIIFLGLRLALGQGWVTADRAHPAIAGVAVLVVSNILLTFALLSEPFYTTYVLIVVVGGGFFILSARWLIALSVGILAAWSVVAWFCSTSHQFVHYGFTLFVATTLSFAVHTMRIRTFRRLELALGAAKRELTERQLAEEQQAQLEAQLLQSQKMEAVGRLAGGVAHDMNNMLAAIMNLASVLKEEVGPDDPLLQDVEGILSACERGRELTQNLLGFSRKGATLKKRICLNRTVEEVAELLGRTIPKRIAVHCRLAPELLEIEGDPNQLQQALINLVLNAVDATPGAGKVTITSANVMPGADDLPSASERGHGSHVELQVADTGTGMSPEACEHAFEPFFTTKKIGEGTGLGLSMAYGTVHGHGGQIFISSEPGQGTTVTIRIPALPAEARAPSAPDRNAADPLTLCPSRGTILLVDDEEMVRRSIQRVLKLLGFSVVPAENGEVAVEQLRRLKGRIDLVILDLVMPVMDGHEAYIELRRIDPELRFIFSSGYAQGQEAPGSIPSDGLFLQKPFDVNQLISALDGLLPKNAA